MEENLRKELTGKLKAWMQVMGMLRGRALDLKLMAGKLLAPLRDHSLLVHLCPVVFILWTVLGSISDIQNIPHTHRPLLF